MNQSLSFFLVAIFSIFIGSQITEGVILVPYWQSLSSNDFYTYYNQYGPAIGKFYTVLTILSALIPITLATYAKTKQGKAFKLTLISSFFAALYILSFYVYFKGTNESFYQATLSEAELKQVLIHWSYWHWGRVVIECISLYFLIRSLIQLKQTNH